MKQSPLLATREASAELGLTSTQFLKLTKQVNMTAAGWYVNPYYRSGPKCPLWAKEDLVKLKGTPELAALMGRAAKTRESKENKAVARKIALEQQFPDWQAALPLAARHMFNLNRYAKWERCSAAHRNEIYALKNEFLRVLYENGFVNEVSLRFIDRPGKLCWECEGVGCGCCRYTGYYRKPDKLFYYSFRLTIDAVEYAWHQPRNLVKWRVVLPASAKPEPWAQEPKEEKPVDLSPGEFADAKAVIRYIIEMVGAGEPVLA